MYYIYHYEKNTINISRLIRYIMTNLMEYLMILMIKDITVGNKFLGNSLSLSEHEVVKVLFSPVSGLFGKISFIARLFF